MKPQFNNKSFLFYLNSFVIILNLGVSLFNLFSGRGFLALTNALVVLFMYLAHRDAFNQFFSYLFELKNYYAQQKQMKKQLQLEQFEREQQLKKTKDIQEKFSNF